MTPRRHILLVNNDRDFGDTLDQARVAWAWSACHGVLCHAARIMVGI